MLLQLENSNKNNIAKLLDFARQNHLQLSLIDDAEGHPFLPGKPLTDIELEKLITESRNSGTIRMEKAHSIIRNSFDGN